MVWVQIDDGFDEHPKVARLGDGAFRAFVEGLCYSNRNLTDGRINSGIARLRGWTRRARELVNAGLWEGDGRGAGYRVHDYPELFRLQPRNHGREQWNAIRKWVAPLLLDLHGHFCAECGCKRDLTVDHVLPLSKGGSSDLYNLQILCRACNSRKGAR